MQNVETMVIKPILVSIKTSACLLKDQYKNISQHTRFKEIISAFNHPWSKAIRSFIFDSDSGSKVLSINDELKQHTPFHLFCFKQIKLK